MLLRCLFLRDEGVELQECHLGFGEECCGLLVVARLKRLVELLESGV